MGALRAAGRDLLVAFFATTRFMAFEVDFLVALAADFRFAGDLADDFLPVRVPERLLAFPRETPRRAGFAAFRAVFRAGFRPLERVRLRELFRAAFLVPPAALRLAITCSLFWRPLNDIVRPEISARLP